jgi:hypothetical protein
MTHPPMKCRHNTPQARATMNSKQKPETGCESEAAASIPALLSRSSPTAPGALGYVVEVDPLFSGMFHILEEEQLELRS